MALPRAPLESYYDVLGLSQSDPQLRTALVEKQAAILTNPDEANRQEKLTMVLTLLDPQLSAEYNLSLSDKLAGKAFETFLSDDAKLLEWFFKIVAISSVGSIATDEIERVQIDLSLAYLNRKFKTHEISAANRKIARLLVTDLTLLDKVFSAITSESEYDRLEYIWNFLKTYFAEAIDFSAIVAHLRIYILEKKFKDSDNENTSLVYPSPASFELLNEIFNSSPILHAEALKAIYDSEGFLATIKSYYTAYMQPPIAHQVIEKNTGGKNLKNKTSQIEKLEIPTLKQCFQYLPTKAMHLV
jgi:hypothetical protein